MKQSHKICFMLAILMVVISWTTALLYWDKLPGVIPIHFGIDGVADGWADKSILYVFLLPIVQTVMLAVLA
jgi:uncharacterized membrane protein